jgi:hypothetical protein
VTKKWTGTLDKNLKTLINAQIKQKCDIKTSSSKYYVQIHEWLKASVGPSLYRSFISAKVIFEKN